MSYINSHNFYHYPFPVWIFDNFFDLDIIKKINKEWPSLDSNLWHHGYEKLDGQTNVLEKKMLAISDINDVPEFTAEFLRYVHSDVLTDEISEITNVKNLISDSSMRWSGLRTMLPNSFQAIHSDARRHPENGLRKELTCLLYLNENIGCLEIWNDDMSKCVHKIKPIENRLVIFLNSDTSYHGVPEVKEIRKSITWSILKDEKSSNRTKALFTTRPDDDFGDLIEKRVNVTRGDK